MNKLKIAKIEELYYVDNHVKLTNEFTIDPNKNSFYIETENLSLSFLGLNHVSINKIFSNIIENVL